MNLGFLLILLRCSDRIGVVIGLLVGRPKITKGIVTAKKPGN